MTRAACARRFLCMPSLSMGWWRSRSSLASASFCHLPLWAAGAAGMARWRLDARLLLRRHPAVCLLFLRGDRRKPDISFIMVRAKDVAGKGSLRSLPPIRATISRYISTHYHPTLPKTRSRIPLPASLAAGAAANGGGRDGKRRDVCARGGRVARNFLLNSAHARLPSWPACASLMRWPLLPWLFLPPLCRLFFLLPLKHPHHIKRNMPPASLGHPLCRRRERPYMVAIARNGFQLMSSMCRHCCWHFARWHVAVK